jgi:hypothetical protein
MFESKMEEDRKGEVTVDDMRPAVLKRVLEFVYTGFCKVEADPAEIEQRSSSSSFNSNSPGCKRGKSKPRASASSSSKENKDSKEAKEDKSAAESKDPVYAGAVELLAAADRFQIGELADLCVEALAGKLTTENLAELFAMSDVYHAPALKNLCVSYLRDNPQRLAEVMDTDAYLKLTQAQLQDLMLCLAPASSNSSSSKKRKREDALTKDQVKKMKISELREELSHRRLDTSGLKADMIERLENALAGEQQSSSSSKKAKT